MTVTTLNKTTVATLTTPDLYWDTVLKGFGLKVRANARGRIQRSFVIQYRVGKRQRKLKLGDATKINVDQARKKAEKLFAQITLGTDPQAERKQERAATAITLRSVIDQYLQKS